MPSMERSPTRAQIVSRSSRATERMLLEGIVSKRRSSPYRSGECKDWRKINTARGEARRIFERGGS
jgi:ATP-dependent DNA ligase